MESVKDIVRSNATNPKLHADMMEKVLLRGDLSGLTSAERLNYIITVCENLGINPITQPFQYLNLNGKTLLYATRACAEQLRQINQVTLTIKAREVTEGCYVVTCQASLPNGRTDESIGAVPLEGLKGESRSNAMMKAETKAKRRVTLSICGLAFVDESEIESIRGASTLEEAPAEKPWKTFKEMIECFAGLKMELSEDIYYKILKAHGVAHSNEFRDPRVALNAYQELQVAIQNFPPAQSETK